MTKFVDDTKWFWIVKTQKFGFPLGSSNILDLQLGLHAEQDSSSNYSSALTNTLTALCNVINLRQLKQLGSCTVWLWCCRVTGTADPVAMGSSGEGLVVKGRWVWKRNAQCCWRELPLAQAAKAERCPSLLKLSAPAAFCAQLRNKELCDEGHGQMLQCHTVLDQHLGNVPRGLGLRRGRHRSPRASLQKLWDN